MPRVLVSDLRRLVVGAFWAPTLLTAHQKKGVFVENLSFVSRRMPISLRFYESFGGYLLAVDVFRRKKSQICLRNVNLFLADTKKSVWL